MVLVDTPTFSAVQRLYLACALGEDRVVLHLALGRDFFGAEALLLAMQRGDPLEARTLSHGAAAHALGGFMPAQAYQVR